MAAIVVGVGDCRVSRDPDSYLITYALGSCIAVSIYDPTRNVGGLLHYMLPESRIDARRAEARPFMFADTGIPLLFQQAYQLGAEKSRLRVVVAGGAQVMDTDEVFNIGTRNHLAMRKILRKAGVPVEAEVVGGTDSRTLRLEISTGRLLVRTAGSVEEEVCSPLPVQRGSEADALRLPGSR
ncbi:MAG TPA: chemotaxis protein CheD [Acidobacteriaceae bacterium]